MWNLEAKARLRLWGLGFGGLGVRSEDLGFRVQGFRFTTTSTAGFRVQSKLQGFSGVL